MSGQKFSAVMLQPHDTPLSQMLAQHRQMLAAVAQAIGEGAPGRAVYPFHPCHCLIQPAAKDFWKGIGGCAILPPVYRNGFLFRPVEVAGLRLRQLPPELVHGILPFLPAGELEQRDIPQGFVFGYLRGAGLLDREAEARIGEIIGGTASWQVKLRVFRLRRVEYSWSQGEVPEAMQWAMGPPRWIKVRAEG